MNTVVVTIRLPAHASGIGIASDLVRRFGDDNVEVSIEADEVDEDEVDADMILTILQGAAQRMGDRPEARQLADLVNALQAPPPAQVPPAAFAKTADEAPAHGMRRPETTRYAKPNATRKPIGNTPERDKAVELLIMNTSCPICGAMRGRSCHSAKSASGETYGIQHVHQARINLMPWADDS
jgi:hypothetical protein